MSDQPNEKQKLTRDEIERLRPHEGQTADEFDQLRRDNQPSKLEDASPPQQVQGGEVLPAPDQEEKDDDGESTRSE